MAQKSQIVGPAPLRHEENGPYSELIGRPNPRRYIIAHIPALGVWLQRAWREIRRELTRTEIARIRDEAPAIALNAKQFKALRISRGYDDVDPTKVFESWIEFKSDLTPPS